ncbi:MAG: hypothetical protein Q4D21_02680 [Phascolarctobacterium sp.]|nr:hypothetical protein [Phascolarctobacterium sp.]
MYLNIGNKKSSWYQTAQYDDNTFLLVCYSRMMAELCSMYLLQEG